MLHCSAKLIVGRATKVFTKKNTLRCQIGPPPDRILRIARSSAFAHDCFTKLCTMFGQGCTRRIVCFIRLEIWINVVYFGMPCDYCRRLQMQNNKENECWSSVGMWWGVISNPSQLIIFRGMLLLDRTTRSGLTIPPKPFLFPIMLWETNRQKTKSRNESDLFSRIVTFLPFFSCRWCCGRSPRIVTVYIFP